MPVGVAHPFGDVVPDVAPGCARLWLRFVDFYSRLEHGRDGGDDGIEREEDWRTKQIEKRATEGRTYGAGHRVALAEARVGHDQRTSRNDAR